MGLPAVSLFGLPTLKLTVERFDRTQATWGRSLGHATW